MVLGIGLAGGEPVSVGLLAAIFVSNLPEAIGGATDMRRQVDSNRQVMLTWLGIAGVCALASGVGYGLADVTGGDFREGLNVFAAGEQLEMLVDTKIPEATEHAGRNTGHVTTLGYAVATWLSLS